MVKSNFTKNDICIYSLGRLQSVRCKNKMKKNFHNGSLSEIIIKKLSKLNNYNNFFAGYEDYFEKICKKYNVTFIKRTKKSALSEGPNKEIHSFLFQSNFQEY